MPSRGPVLSLGLTSPLESEELAPGAWTQLASLDSGQIFQEPGFQGRGNARTCWGAGKSHPPRPVLLASALGPGAGPTGSPSPPRDRAMGLSFSPSHRSWEGPMTWCCPCVRAAATVSTQVSLEKLSPASFLCHKRWTVVSHLSCGREEISPNPELMGGYLLVRPPRRPL